MMIRADSADYLHLFLSDVALLDLRAPLEFVKGAFPCSVSLPLMDDDERAQVGTCYKKHGQAAAIRLGHRLVSGAVKEARMAAWLQFIQQHPQGYLYCWRGGLRSQTVQEWLAAAAAPYPRVVGGYKAMRRFLIDEEVCILAKTPLLLVAGRTGSAKTKLLQQLPGSIDLEGLAHHKGSSFGKHPEGQPTQLNFENALAIALLRHHYREGHHPIFLEDEGELIGRSALPLVWRMKMQTAPYVVIDSPFEDRLWHSYQNYILQKLNEWQHAVGEAVAFAAFADDLKQSLFNIRKRLGGLRYQQLDALMQEALVQHSRGNPEAHCAWIKILLTDYYDPMYDHQLTKKVGKLLFRGSFAAVRDYCQNLNPTAMGDITFNQAAVS